MKLNETISPLTQQRVITTTLQKALVYLALAVLGGVVTGAFAWGNLLNTDHFTLVAAVDDIEYLKSDHTSKAEVATIISSFQGQLTDIKKAVDNTNNLIISHMSQK